MKELSFFQLATPAVQQLNPYQPGKPISELKRQLGLEEVTKLASNENPLGTSPKVREVIQNNLAELTRYPDGNGFYLKQALARKLDVKAEQITLGNGSNDVLDLLARVFLTPQSEAVFSQYAFAVYPISTQAVGATAKVADAAVGNERWMQYGHDLDAILALVGENCRLIFIANPNNPTGTWFGRQQLDDFLKAVPEQTVVVVDEAYFEYVDDHDYPDALQWLNRHPNLVVTRTFSKAYGLAGLRVGYSVSNAEIADLLNRVRQPFNVTSLALLAAETALEDNDYLEESKKLNRMGLKQLHDGLLERNFEPIPSVGNFICVDMGGAALPIYHGLLEQGVIVRPVDNYGLPDHLRVSVGTERENWAFLHALDGVTP